MQDFIRNIAPATAIFMLSACSDPAPYPEEGPPVDDLPAENRTAQAAQNGDALANDDVVLPGDTIGADLVPDRDDTLTQDDVRDVDPVELDVDDVTMPEEARDD